MPKQPEKKTPEQKAIEELTKKNAKLEKIVAQLLPAHKKLVNTCTKLQREVKRLDGDLQRSKRSLSQEIERRTSR